MRFKLPTVLFIAVSVLLLSQLLSVPVVSAVTHEKILDRPPNVIYMIGDGMGFEQVKTASVVEYGDVNLTIMDTDFPYMHFVGTDDIEGEITDSAAGGTALGTGQKTLSGRIGMDQDGTIFYKNILEYMKFDFGYATGLISNTEQAHATQGSFSAHVDNREDKDEIQEQMLSKGIDIILTGGLDVSYIGGETAAINLSNKYNYDLVTNTADLLSNASTSDKLMGLFDGPYFPYELERDPVRSPSMVQMTESAITLLDNKDEPFFLMVEGGLIDYAGHLASYNEHRTLYNALETINFEKAVRVAYEFAVNDGNTIVIVGADHETGGLTLLDYSNLSNELPNEDNTRDENNQIREDRVANISTSWYWTSHTRTPVPFYMYGADFSEPLTENIEVFWALVGQLGSFPGVLNQEFEISGNNLLVNAEIRDMDKSATEAQLIIDYGNIDDEVVVQELIFDTDIIELEFNYTTSSTDYTAYLKIIDGGVNNVLSFTDENALVQQMIVDEISDTSETTSSSIPSSTTSDTDTDTDTADYSFIGLSIIVVIPLIRKKTK